MAALLGITGVALTLRVLPVAQADFPLGDGGLLVGLTNDLLRYGPGLPAWATYNGGALPYAYPPLAFYGVAGLTMLTGIPVLFWVQWLPPLLSAAMVPVGYALVRRASGCVEIAIAAAVFLALGNGYRSLILGGGLTKATGLLLAMLAIERGLALLERPSPGRVVSTGGLAGLAALAHPAASLFVILSLGWAWLIRSRGRRSLAALAASGAVAGLVVLPWLLTVLSTHGPGPLLSAASIDRNLDGFLGNLAAAFLRLHPLPIFGVLVLAGFLRELRRGHWFAPGWLLLIVAIDQRNAYMTSLPAVGWLVGVGWRVLTMSTRELIGGRPALRHWRQPGLVLLSAALILPMLLWPSQQLAVGRRRALTSGDQAAAVWLATHTSPGTRVAVVTGRPWSLDDLSEWLPQLSGRISVATPQGSEWLGATAWSQIVRGHDALQQCAAADLACLKQWAGAFSITAELVYLPGPGSSVDEPGLPGIAAPVGIGRVPQVDCCASLRTALDAARVPLLYSTSSARIYALRLGG